MLDHRVPDVASGEDFSLDLELCLSLDVSRCHGPNRCLGVLELVALAVVVQRLLGKAILVAYRLHGDTTRHEC